MAAAHDLEAIKELLAADRFKASRTRASEPVAAKCRCTYREARTRIKELVERLTSKDFCETTIQQFSQKWDVYAIRDDSCGWYIKLGISPSNLDGDDEVVIVSCHPLEKTIKTRGGTVDP